MYAPADASRGDAHGAPGHSATVRLPNGSGEGAKVKSTVRPAPSYPSGLRNSIAALEKCTCRIHFLGTISSLRGPTPNYCRQAKATSIRPRPSLTLRRRLPEGLML